MKTDKEKAAEILRKRRMAQKGLEEKPGGNTLEDIEEREEEVQDEALAVDFGLKR